MVGQRRILPSRLSERPEGNGFDSRVASERPPTQAGFRIAFQTAGDSRTPAVAGHQSLTATGQNLVATRARVCKIARIRRAALVPEERGRRLPRASTSAQRRYPRGVAL